MQNKFSWKGFKIGLIGVFVGAIALFIEFNNTINNVLMLIGIGIVFVGGYLHNAEMFRRQDNE